MGDDDDLDQDQDNEEGTKLFSNFDELIISAAFERN